MAEKLTPEVLWAQRSSTTDPSKNHVFLTLTVPDVSKDKLKLDLTDTKLSFSGESRKGVTYAVDLEFYAEIDPKESRINHTDRDIEMVLRKKELKEEYWPRLLKEKRKMHFLKTDFDKWVDEDEQDAVADDDDYMQRMNAMGGGDQGFGGIDFSKLGGGDDLAGGEEAEEDDDDDDDEMPGLEGDDGKPAPKADAKIEEVK